MQQVRLPQLLPRAPDEYQAEAVTNQQETDSAYLQALWQAGDVLESPSAQSASKSDSKTTEDNNTDHQSILSERGTEMTTVKVSALRPMSFPFSFGRTQHFP
jgi:hypothetical protein